MKDLIGALMWWLLVVLVAGMWVFAIVNPLL